MAKDFVDPNEIFDPDSYSFIYVNPTGKIYIGKNLSHLGLIFSKGELRELLNVWGKLVWAGEKWDALFGRVGIHRDGNILIAFWEIGPIASNRKYRNVWDCIKKLESVINRLKTAYPEARVMLSVEREGMFPLEDLDSRMGIRASSVSLSSEERERLEKELRTAVGKDRDRIARMLGKGISLSPPDKHPWRSAVKRSGYTWPPYSEGFESCVVGLADGDPSFGSSFLCNRLRALMEALRAPEIDWIQKEERRWKGRFQIGEKRFFLILYQKFPRRWDVSFSQMDSAGSPIGFHGDMAPLSLVELAQLGLVLDSALQEFFEESPEVEEVSIYPFSASFSRQSKIDKRSGGSSLSMFDKNKMNAYMFMFDSSELKRRGFSMTQEGRELIIRRPESGSFEKEVDRISGQLRMQYA